MKGRFTSGLGFAALLCALGFASGCNLILGIPDVPDTRDSGAEPFDATSLDGGAADGDATVPEAAPDAFSADDADDALDAAMPDAPAPADAGPQDAPEEPESDAYEPDAAPPLDAADAGCSGLACDGGCVENDVHNCGVCGHDCTALPHVSGPVTCTPSGACAFLLSSCALGWTHCSANPDQGCETNFTTASNCGSCGTVCPNADPVCSPADGGYACSTGCAASTPSLCGQTCVDLTSDPNNCSGCGKACTTNVAHAQPACATSNCTFACNNGYSPCGGACVDLTNDDMNCGACGTICTGVKHCVANVCQCPAGNHDCGGTCVSNSSTQSCGTSCSPCSAPPNYVATCDGTSCGTSCPHLCGSACVNPQTDTSNCGACNHACSPGETCSDGMCLVPLGCFADNASSHDISATSQTTTTNTPASCVSFCAASGNPFAAVQGNVCYCGQTFDNYGSSTACTAPCPGNASDVCGGTNANSIYMVTYPSTSNPASAFLGCFVDCPGGSNCKGGASPRDLPAGEAVTNETQATCIAACKAAGYRYAGAQDGTQCFCGNSFGAYGSIPTACGVPCAGNGAQVCGDIWFNSIFITLGQ